MGRNFKPTVLLDASGAFIKHPERKRPNEPKSERPLGPPPKYLSAELKQVWKEIAKRHPAGVLLETDRDAFELMVRLTYKMRVEPAAGLMMAAERSQLISLWSRFAMTPADRSRVSVDKSKESGLDAFLSRRKKQAPPVEAPPAEPPAEENSLIN